MRDLRLYSDHLASASPPGAGAWVAPWRAPRGSRTWRLKRNCALRPYQFLAAMGMLMGLSALVALACWIRGLWLVPIFCSIELVAIAVAVLAYAPHAVDGEIVTLTAERQVRVEVDRGTRRDAYVFQAHRLRVVRDDKNALWLRDGDMRVKVGSHASESARDMFAAELREALSGR
jgi:uncharacterized membrane protein